MEVAEVLEQSFQDTSCDLVIPAKVSPYFWVNLGLFFQVLKTVAVPSHSSPLVCDGNFATLK